MNAARHQRGDPGRTRQYDAASVEARFLAGEPQAHGQVSLWVAHVVTTFRFRILRTEWPDLHQEVLTRLLEALRHGRFDPSLEFRIYAQSVARYTMLENVRRKLRRQRDSEAEWANPEPTMSGEDPILTRHAVDRILTQVQADCRRLFRIIFFDQKSYAEAARDLGVPVGTVKSRLSRCLEKARKLAVGEPNDQHESTNSPGGRSSPDPSLEA